jgi:hypothetical protein
MKRPTPDAAARARALRLIQWVFLADIAAGLVLWLIAGELGVDEDLASALRIVGLGLAVAGFIGYLIFSALARGVRKRP